MENEFAYDLTIDPGAENNTHAYALEMIGYNKRVLEVGCATGYFTKVLAEHGCKVVGMELDPDAATQAESWAEQVVVGSADDAETWDRIDDEAFDVITFGDVLEHLHDPLGVLRTAVRKLKPEGVVVTSLPNIAHGDMRLSLLRGSFEYRETGLLDRTHVKFFTLETVRELLRGAGLVVVDTRRVVLPLFHTEFNLRPEDFTAAVLDEVRVDPEAQTYQFVMKSVLDNGSAAVADLAHRLEALTDKAHELELGNRRLREQLAGHTEMQMEYDRITGEMQGLTDHVADLTRQVHQLHHELGLEAGRRETLEAATESLAGANELLEGVLEETRRALAEREQECGALRRSVSYRVTAPLRKVQTFLRSAR